MPQHSHASEGLTHTGGHWGSNKRNMKLQGVEGKAHPDPSAHNRHSATSPTLWAGPLVMEAARGQGGSHLLPSLLHQGAPGPANQTCCPPLERAPTPGHCHSLACQETLAWGESISPPASVGKGTNTFDNWQSNCQQTCLQLVSKPGPNLSSGPASIDQEMSTYPPAASP